MGISDSNVRPWYQAHAGGEHASMEVHQMKNRWMKILAALVSVGLLTCSTGIECNIILDDEDGDLEEAWQDFWDEVEDLF
jgi:hypothetical protein